ncbi:MAG TPA: EAL domain-containing protein [Longimicrobiaceae bacterium]|jgi:diguanylate cyclase (GGDEF)-like protein/PAS domain S-box-containing protein
MTFVRHAHDPFIAALLQSIDDHAVFTVDHAGYVTRWNAVAERVTGFAADEVVGRHVGALAGNGDGGEDDYERVLQQAAQAGRLEVEREWRRKGGGTFRAAGRITAIRGERGDLLGFVAVLRDPDGGGEVPDAWRAASPAPALDSFLALYPDPAAAFDAEARFVQANAAWEALAGAAPGSLAGTSLLLRVAPEDRRRLLDAFHQASRGEAQRLDVALADGGGLGLTCFPRPDGDGAAGLWAVARDARALRAADEALRRDEAFFRGMVEGMGGAFFYSLDAGGRFGYLSPGVKQVLGYRPEELAGLSFGDLLETPAADPPAGARPRTATLALRHRDGRRVQVETAEAPPAGDGEGAALHGFARDVTRAREAEERLLRGSLEDALTGLPGRAVFMDRLAHAARRGVRRPQERHGLLLVDLDRFGLVNDAMGRELGDLLLVEVARRLRRCVRPGDTLCRLRSDEFGLLLEGLAGPEAAIGVAERIGRALASPFRLRSHELQVGASIGIALGGPAGAEPEELLRDAAVALGEARARGGAGYELAGSELRAGVRSRAEREEELRRAIERNELALVYQPVVSLRTGDVTGFEALVRWRHPERGTVHPAEFLPLAEDTGLILAVDRWVLGEACRRLRSWQDEFPDRECRISVNLSGRQLASPGAADRIRGALEECSVPPLSLQVEVREDSLAEGEELSAAVLRRIDELGVRVQLDDFGGGDGSLTRLRRIPARVLKIDPANLEGGDDMVRAAVGMAHSLDISVVAQGIETTEQLDRLRAMDFDFGQGYLFSEPVDGDLAALLLSRRLPL